MERETSSTGGNVIPGLRYLDAPRAIDWLCEAFGFEKHLVVEGTAARLLMLSSPSTMG